MWSAKGKKWPWNVNFRLIGWRYIPWCLEGIGLGETLFVPDLPWLNGENRPHKRQVWSRVTSTNFAWFEDVLSSECASSFASEIAMRKCQNERVCTLVADESTFGNQCPSGTKKYLTISYACGKPNKYAIPILAVLWLRKPEAEPARTS